VTVPAAVLFVFAGVLAVIAYALAEVSNRRFKDSQRILAEARRLYDVADARVGEWQAEATAEANREAGA
jgi:hypothetical protein